VQCHPVFAPHKTRIIQIDGFSGAGQVVEFAARYGFLNFLLGNLLKNEHGLSLY